MSDEATPRGQGHPQPVVFFPFKPTHYEVVTEERRLQDWEDALAEKVGLRGVSVAREGFMMSKSVSLCGGFWCDCDQVEM